MFCKSLYMLSIATHYVMFNTTSIDGRGLVSCTSII